MGSEAPWGSIWADEPDKDKSNGKLLVGFISDQLIRRLTGSQSKPTVKMGNLPFFSTSCLPSGKDHHDDHKPWQASYPSSHVEFVVRMAVARTRFTGRSRHVRCGLEVQCCANQPKVNIGEGGYTQRSSSRTSSQRRRLVMFSANKRARSGSFFD